MLFSIIVILCGKYQFLLDLVFINVGSRGLMDRELDL